MSVVDTIALSMGVAWASGINLYAAILTLGILGTGGHIQLPPGLEILTHPAVIGTAGFMYFLEFFADKIPGVDTAWDAIHTFIRIPAGAVLAARAVGNVSPEAELIAGLLGGTLAAGTHFTKFGVRALLNLSPEPVTNWVASVTEDAVVVAGTFAAVQYPSLFLGFLIVFILLAIWLLPKIWRALKSVARRIAAWWRGGPGDTAGDEAGGDEGAGRPPPGRETAAG